MTVEGGADSDVMVVSTASVVICAYTERRWEDLVRAVESVRAQTVPALEVVIVIDHNSALVERTQAEFPDARVVTNQRERGLSGARNTVLPLVRGEIVAFLDDDAIAEPDWLRWLLAAYQDASVIAVGGTARPLWPDGTRPALFPARDEVGELDWIVGCSYQGQHRQHSQPAEVRNLMGCNMSFRTRVFDRVGGFNAHIGRVGTIPLGCEETELCIRARQLLPESRILFEPRAAVRHRVGTDRVRWAYLRRRSWSEGLSKAAISGLVGKQDALSTERDYVRRILPAAMRRELRKALRGERAGLAGAVAVPMALAWTAAGYGYGLLRRPRHPHGDRLRHGDRLHRSSGEPRRVSVVVPTADRPDAAARCVRTLLDTGYPELEVLLVDNRPHSPHALALRAIAASDSRLHYVPEPHPGASIARNTGASAATGELIAFVDDDIQVDQRWLKTMVEEFADPEVDCVTSRVSPTSLSTPAQQAFEQLKGFGRGPTRHRFGPESRAQDPLYPFAPGHFGPGGCAVWRRETFLRVGGFNPLLGPGTPTCAGEDLELFLRLARCDGVIVYAPDALAWHEHRTEWSTLRAQLRGYGIGLSAMMCAHLVRRPWDLLALVRRLPGLVRRQRSLGLLRSITEQNANVRQLRRDELLGVLFGPFALISSALTASGSSEARA